MGQVIIIGRNGNYPTKEELPELSAIAGISAPYSEAMMRVLQNKAKGYPMIAFLPELYDSPDTRPPYPDAIMRCLGSDINEGYPCILSVEGVEREIVSNLFFGASPVEAMYYNDQFIPSAYCGGKQVLGVRYVKK